MLRELERAAPTMSDTPVRRPGRFLSALQQLLLQGRGLKVVDEVERARAKLDILDLANRVEVKVAVRGGVDALAEFRVRELAQLVLHVWSGQ